jgi:hypothetical protein
MMSSNIVPNKFGLTARPGESPTTFTIRLLRAETLNEAIQALNNLRYELNGQHNNATLQRAIEVLQRLYSK